MIRYPHAMVSEQIRHVLHGFGLEDSHKQLIVDGMLYADLRGVDSHGIALLPLYHNWLSEGSLDVSGRPHVVKKDAASAMIDGGGNFGFLAATAACEEAIEIAKESGVAAVTVSHSHHFGAAGYYAHKIAEAGFLSFVTTSTKVVCVVPPGAKDPVLGTNPLAYGVPRADSDPIIFDIATSTAAGNRIRVFKYQNKQVPEGWIVDADGQSVTDPSIAEDIVYGRIRGGITPLGSKLTLGSHKGYGLSLMTHFFAGCLSGGSFSGRVRLPEEERRTPLGKDNIGHFFLAIDPGHFGSNSDFLTAVDEVADSLHATSAIDDENPVLLPGEIESRIYRERINDGIPISETLVHQVKQLAIKLKVPVVLD